MKSLILGFTLPVALAVGVGIGHDTTPDPAPVTICASTTQTHCLWVDGTSEWR